jgi:site-specific DNA recombinase
VQAVIYTRVSKDVSAGRSVQDQESECRSICERNGWKVRRVFCDNDIGASRHSPKDRPAWRELKGDLRKGDILVVWEASRAQRDLEEFVALRNLCAEHEVPLSYAGRVLDLTLGDDRFTGGLDALLAEREAEVIRTRVLRGTRAAAAAGRPHARPPWGYVRIDPGVWRIDPVEGPRVREAMARVLAGETRYSVLEWLRRTGYAPARLSGLKRTLTNPVYAGLRVHQGNVVGKGSWEPIISEGDHDRLVDLNPPDFDRTGPEARYLLSGIARCGVCERALRAKNRPRRRPTYECHKGHCVRDMEYLDDLVLTELFKRLESIDPGQYESEDAIAAAAIKEIKEIEGDLADYRRLARERQISPASFVEIEKGLNDRIKELRPKAAPSPVRQLSADELRLAWPALSTGERRDVIRGYFRITINPMERRSRGARGGADLIPL